VQIRHISRIWLGTPCLLATLLCSAAHAFQRVTLRNGFSYDCARYEPIDNSHIRLFLASTTPQSPNPTPDFIDLPKQSIASIETLPDPPQPAPTPTAATPIANVLELLTEAGQQHHIDAELLASIVHAESGGHPNAISHTGARGLMQLMPGTAQQLGVDDAFRPDQNIAGGSTYLDQLLDRYDPLNDTRGLALALAAYNAGPAAVDRCHGIPPYRETRAYVARVMNEFKRRKLALDHPQERPRNISPNPSPTPAQNIASLGAQ
jgi:soluble lytic murein transglycosylase-like protein